MKEKIECINFNEITLEESQELLNELLSYDGVEFKDLVMSIIDKIDESAFTGSIIPPPIDLLFSEKRVSLVVGELLEEYEVEGE